MNSAATVVPSMSQSACYCCPPKSSYQAGGTASAPHLADLDRALNELGK